MSNIKLDKTAYASLIKTSGEMLESILEQVKADFQGKWDYANAQALGQLSEDLAAMGKPLKLCQSLKGLSMLSTAPWAVVKPEQTGKTVYQFSKLGYKLWASTPPNPPVAPANQSTPPAETTVDQPETPPVDTPPETPVVG